MSSVRKFTGRSAKNEIFIEISLDAGLIVEIKEIFRDDQAPLRLLPGFTDIHNHGAVGIDVNLANAGDLYKVAEFLALNGVTSWMPTLVPDSDEAYLRTILAIDELMLLQTDRPVAQAVGVHYEGVFANERMCGALRPEFFKTSGQWSVAGGQLPRLKSGVHMTTLAPEIEGGIELIEAMVADGWVVAIGHTSADTETLDRAFEAGARHMTHFFNAMTGLHHRDVGVVGWGLANRGVTFDIIADGIHVAPEILEIACRAKKPEMVTLISDSVAPAGMGDGEFELWGETISVAGGRTRNEQGSIAGSVVTLLECVRTMSNLGFSHVDVARMASTNPAALLGLNDRGSIEIGKRADLVAFDEKGELAFTVIGGQLVE